MTSVLRIELKYRVLFTYHTGNHGFPFHAQLEVELLIIPGWWIAAATDNSRAEEVFQRQTWVVLFNE